MAGSSKWVRSFLTSDIIFLLYSFPILSNVYWDIQLLIYLCFLRVSKPREYLFPSHPYVDAFSKAHTLGKAPPLPSIKSFPHSSVGKESARHAADLGLIPGMGISPGKANGNSPQYSCLGNPTDRENWGATVLGVTRVGHDLVTKPPSPFLLSVVCAAEAKFWLLNFLCSFAGL